MTLLILLAGLTALFRFVSTVTILQQASSPSTPRPHTAGRARAKGQGVRQVLSAKELGKRWRFFPTYAEL
jgi:hypothetical protein